MAKTPGQKSNEQGDESLSLGGDATDRAVLDLTPSAARYAGKEGIGALLTALSPDPAMQIGDTVSFQAGGKRHDFSVLRRRWLAEGERARLEVTLDHPARPAGR